MFPPKLTEEQKIHAKAATRSNMHLRLTWDLYMMFLGMDNSPIVALGKARDAVEVWISHEDITYVEYPELPEVDYKQEITGEVASIMGNVFNTLKDKMREDRIEDEYPSTDDKDNTNDQKTIQG
jgi:hypothetical protein